MVRTVHRRTRLLAWAVLGVLLGSGLASAATRVETAAAPSFDESRFDADVYPAIDVIHRPPSILVAGEAVPLGFAFVCGYANGAGQCRPSARLFVAHGSDPFTEIKVEEWDRDTLAGVGARLPAAAANNDDSLRYYLEVVDETRDVSLRYPTAGYFESVVAVDPVEVRLGTARAVDGEAVAAFGWGPGPGNVGVEQGPERPTSGPEAIAVAPSGGLLAVLDGINQRVVVRDLTTRTEFHFEVDAQLGDLAITDEGRVTVLDSVGVSDGSGPPIPRLSLFDASGTLLRSAPVFLDTPHAILPNGAVVGIDGLTVTPFTRAGHARDRTAQRTSFGPRPLDAFFRHDGSVLLADRSLDATYRVTAEDGVGPIATFQQTPQGYVVAMGSLDGVRVAWFDPSGRVLDYVAVRIDSWADSSPTERIDVDSNGDVYVWETTSAGAQVIMIEEGMP